MKKILLILSILAFYTYSSELSGEIIVKQEIPLSYQDTYNSNEDGSTIHDYSSGIHFKKFKSKNIKLDLDSENPWIPDYKQGCSIIPTLYSKEKISSDKTAIPKGTIFKIRHVEDDNLGAGPMIRLLTRVILGFFKAVESEYHVFAIKVSDGGRLDYRLHLKCKSRTPFPRKLSYKNMKKVFSEYLEFVNIKSKQ